MSAHPLMKKSITAFLALCILLLPAQAVARRGHNRGFRPPHFGPGPAWPHPHPGHPHFGPGPAWPHPHPWHPHFGPGPVWPDPGHRRHRRHHRHWHPRHNNGDVAAAALVGVLGGLALGSIVASRPDGFKTVYINGNEYYLHNGTYYQRCPSGYVVVNPPQEPKTEAPLANPPVVINVPNANGSYTPVRLTPSGTGYLGPKGEFYQNLPTVSQLAPVYGLKSDDTQ